MSDDRCPRLKEEPQEYLDLKISFLLSDFIVNKEDNEIQKIVRLGKEIDERNRVIDDMKFEYNKLMRKYEIELQNLRAVKRKLEDREYELKRYKPADIVDENAPLNTITKEVQNIETVNKSQITKLPSTDSLAMKKSKLIDKLLRIK